MSEPAGFQFWDSSSPIKIVSQDSPGSSNSPIKTQKNEATQQGEARLLERHVAGATPDTAGSASPARLEADAANVTGSAQPSEMGDAGLDVERDAISLDAFRDDGFVQDHIKGAQMPVRGQQLSATPAPAAALADVARDGCVR
jgi:hypothetical protein